MRTPALRFYFCFRSPYSWIATLLLEKYLQHRPQTPAIEYLPSWEAGVEIKELLSERGAEFLFKPMSAAKQRYILQDVKRLTGKLDLRMKWPVDWNPCWDVPHLAYLAAKRAGKAHAFMLEVLAARWGEGRNICEEEVILAIADKIELNQNVVLDSLHDPSIRDEGVDVLYQGYKDDVFGVPFFVHSFKKFWGTNNFDDFIKSIEEDKTLHSA